MLDSTKKVLQEVADERIRQDTKWGEQNHQDFVPTPLRLCISQETWRLHRREAYDMCSADDAKELCDKATEAGTLTWGHIAIEEIAEAYEEEPNSDGLREELIQAAAVLVAWVECIDRRRAGELEKLEMKAQDLQLGDLFEYVGSFARYKVESAPIRKIESDGETSMVFNHSRDGQMIGTGCRLRYGQPVRIWRRKV